MSDPPTRTVSRRLGRSIFAIFLGFLAVVVLSLGTDEVFYLLQVYPPWNQPMNETHSSAMCLAGRPTARLIERGTLER